MIPGDRRHRRRRPGRRTGRPLLRIPERRDELPGRPVRCRRPLLFDLGQPRSAQPAHLVLGEDRFSQRLGEQVQGGAQVPQRYVDIDEQRRVVDAGGEGDAVALQERRILLGRVAGGPLVEELTHQRRDPLDLPRLGRQGQRDDETDRDDVLAGYVVGDDPQPVGQGPVARRGREGPRTRRCDGGTLQTHAASSEVSSTRYATHTRCSGRSQVRADSCTRSNGMASSRSRAVLM